MSVRWMSSLIVAGMLLVGCEQQESATPAPQAPAGAADAASDAAASATDAVKSAGAAASDAAKSAGAAAKDAGAAAKDAGAAAVDSAKSTAADATAAAADATKAAGAEAQKMIDQAMAYIKENKLDLAETAITKLEGMKASLPANLQTAVDGARKALSAAKSSGLVAPAAPK